MHKYNAVAKSTVCWALQKFAQKLLISCYQLKVLLCRFENLLTCLCVHIKTIPWNVCIFHPNFLELFALKFVKFSNFSHILRAHIWKSKRCFNVKSSTNYFQMTTKILAAFQICISVPLRFFRVLTHVFFNMRHFRLQIFQPCYGTQRNHILDETGTKTILWKTFLLNIVSRVCKFTKK